MWGYQSYHHNLYFRLSMGRKNRNSKHVSSNTDLNQSCLVTPHILMGFPQLKARKSVLVNILLTFTNHYVTWPLWSLKLALLNRYKKGYSVYQNEIITLYNCFHGLIIASWWCNAYVGVYVHVLPINMIRIMRLIKDESSHRPNERGNIFRLKE